LAELKQQLSDTKKGFEEHMRHPVIYVTVTYNHLATGCRVEGNKEDTGHS